MELLFGEPVVFEDWNDVRRIKKQLVKAFNKYQEERGEEAEEEKGNEKQDSVSPPWRPTLDYKETPKEIVIYVDLPGVPKESINVDKRENLLVIFGEKPEKKEENAKYLRKERVYGSFKREVNLPPGLKEADIKANFTNGVLELTYPRQAPQSDSKKIAIL